MSKLLNYEEKLVKLKEFDMFAGLHMRKPGDWYFSVRNVEIKDGGFLVSFSGNGNTPEAAVEDYWKQITKQPVVVDASTKNRRVVYWNGEEWKTT